MASSPSGDTELYSGKSGSRSRGVVRGASSIMIGTLAAGPGHPEDRLTGRPASAEAQVALGGLPVGGDGVLRGLQRDLPVADGGVQRVLDLVLGVRGGRGLRP